MPPAGFAVRKSPKALRLIDTHAHFGCTVTRLPIKQQSATSYVAGMQELGIEAAFAAPAAGYDMTDGMSATVRQNDSIAAQCRERADKFPVGLAILEPRLGVERGTSEVRRAVRELGLRGACVVPRLSGGPLGETVVPTLRILEEFGGMLLVHTDLQAPQFVAKHADVFSNCVFVLSHAQRYPRRDVIRLADHENVYIDISQDPRDHRMRARVPGVIDAYRSDRILWGTDSPYYSPADAIQNLLQLATCDRVFQQVGRENALALQSRLCS